MKSKYYTNVYPYLKDIEKWSKAGVLEKNIYKALGIKKSTFYK